MICKIFQRRNTHQAQAQPLVYDKFTSSSMKAFHKCVNFQRHGQCSLAPVAPQRMSYKKHSQDTAHNVGKQSEMKPDSYHYYICFVFSSSECLWGVCIHAHLHVWALRGPCEEGDTGSCFCAGWWDVHARSISQSRGEEKLESPNLGTPILGPECASNGARLVGRFPVL